MTGPFPESTIPADAFGSLTDPEAARRAMAAVAEAIADARIQIDGGAFIDLRGLDQSVAAICNALVGFDRAIGQPLLPTLVELAAGLEAMSATLARQHNTATGTAEHGRRQRAAEAYGRPRE